MKVTCYKKDAFQNLIVMQRMHLSLGPDFLLLRIKAKLFNHSVTHCASLNMMSNIMGDSNLA